MTLKLIRLPLLMALMLLLLVSCGGASQVVDTQSQAEESTASGFLDPKQFFNDLDQNIVAATAKYSGQNLLFAGVIDQVGFGTTSYDSPLVNIKFRDAEGMGGWLQAMIICVVPDLDTISGFSRGDSLTVEGIGIRMNQYGATLEPCSILSHTES
jgi:hypothetical protein